MKLIKQFTCLVACFVVLSSSFMVGYAVEEDYFDDYVYEELPEPYFDENGDYIYPLDWSMVPSFWDMGYMNFSWFNPDSIPWDTFPSYIQEIVYMSLSGMVLDTKEGYKVPFVMVKVWSSSVSVYVGLNVGLGGYVSSNTSNPTFYRICSINSSYFEPGVHSVLYSASFDTNLNLVSSWEALEPLEWGSEGRVYYYNGTQLSSSHNCDLYMYGSNGVATSPRTGYKVFNAFGNSTGVAFQIYNVGSGTSALSTNGFYYNGDFNSQFPNVGVRYFVPLTPEQIKKKVDEERNSLLENILGEFQVSGESDLTTLPGEALDDYNKAESDLVSGYNPDNIEDDLDIELDPSALQFIWDLFDEFVTADNAVFTLFISIMAVGIIALILGR